MIFAALTITAAALAQKQEPVYFALKPGVPMVTKSTTVVATTTTITMPEKEVLEALKLQLMKSGIAVPDGEISMDCTFFVPSAYWQRKLSSDQPRTCTLTIRNQK